jgi:uncharacterized protein (PEP-CTERM system associated)
MVSPEVSLRETYTDNAFLGVGTPRSDWVTQVTPGIRIDGRSSRLTANLSYRPTALFYAHNHEANDLANNLNAYAQLQAVEKFFFVEAAGYISQSFITPFAAQPGDILTVTNNRTETRTGSLSPFVRHEGRDLEYELRNRTTWTTTNREELGKARTRQWFGHVGAPVRRFGWALEFNDTEISRYQLPVPRPDDEARLYRGRLFYEPDPAWRVSASAGSEENNYVLNQMQRSTIYGAGLTWRPSGRTSAELSYERRFFGPSHLARLSHRTRLTAWNLSYSRNTTTYQEEVLRLPPGNTAGLLDAVFTARFPDPEQRRAAVDQFVRTSGTPAFLSNPLVFYTQRVYLREGLDASFGIVGSRNSLIFTAFASESSSLSADALGLLLDPSSAALRIRQRGFGAYAEHKLTPFTSVGARAARTLTRGVQPTENNSRNDYLNVTLSHTVSPKTTTFAGISASRFASDDTSFNPNQDANSVFVGLSHRF